MDMRESFARAPHARKATKAAGKWLLSGVGLSAAYFLDPANGTARRKHAVEFLDHTCRKIARSKIMNVDPNAPKWEDYVTERRPEPEYLANGANFTLPLGVKGTSSRH
jgi:hypothetical protein